jgi:hypothetical protein
MILYNSVEDNLEKLTVAHLSGNTQIFMDYEPGLQQALSH